MLLELLNKKKNLEMRAKKLNYGKFKLKMSKDKNLRKLKMKETLEILKSLN